MFGQRARLKRPCSMSKPSPLLQGLSCRRGQFLDNEHGQFCRLREETLDLHHQFEEDSCLIFHFMLLIMKKNNRAFDELLIKFSKP